jgi:hypothetical protein
MTEGRSSTDWSVNESNTTVWREDLREPSTSDSNVTQLIVQSVFGRSGVVTAVAGDYESALVTVAPAISAARPWGDVRMYLTNLSTQVDTAQSAATAANTAAGNAQTAADAANTAATAAQTTANTANSAASTAQTTANSATTAAATADSKAVAAQSTANSANSAASTAQTTASAALPKAGGTMTGAIVLAGDGSAALNPVSKQQLDVIGTTATNAMPQSGGTFTGQVTFGTTGATILPAGSTVQRPASASAGMLRYNSQSGAFEGYTTAWGPLGGGGGAATAIGITPPASPTVGQLWWNSDASDGSIYIWFNDGTSSQWVPIWVPQTQASLFDTGIWYPGAPAASAVLLRFVAVTPFSLPAGLTGSSGYAGTTATGSATINIRKNGSNQGTVVFAAGTATPTFALASALSFAAGDRLELVGPASADATLADISVTLKGVR